LEHLPQWLARQARVLGEAMQPELSIVHYKGFGKTLDIRAQPPPEEMMRKLRQADVVVFDGDDFEVADGAHGVCVNFVCALPMIFASGDWSAERRPALLAFKLEDQEAGFLGSWHGLRCCIGRDGLPFKAAAAAPGWAADRVIEITYILIPQVVCSPSYRGGVLWRGSVGSQLPPQRSHIFAAILDDAKQINGWCDVIELNRLRLSDNLPPFTTQPHYCESQSAHIQVVAGQSHAPAAAAPDPDPAHAHAHAHAHQGSQAVVPDTPTMLYFSQVQEHALPPLASCYVSLGTLATLATAAVDARLVRLKRQVVAWGGYHIVACELSAESALFMPNFAQALPWHYFHAVRTKQVGAAVERQEGALKAAQFHGLHCH
jgi:hypothetical protein